MKHYIAEIQERNGDFEYDIKYLFATTKNADKYSDKVAMKWRGGSKKDWDDYMNGYWCDGTVIIDQGSKEIPESDFNVLKKYLAVL